jgi:hypothetical protein
MGGYARKQNDLLYGPHPQRRAEPSHTVLGIYGPYEIGSSLTVANTPVAPGCDKLAPQTAAAAAVGAVTVTVTVTGT